MSKSFKGNNLDSELLDLDLPVVKIDGSFNADNSLSKTSNSFDSELNLLESTLTQLSDVEHESISTGNDKTLVDVHSGILIKTCSGNKPSLDRFSVPILLGAPSKIKCSNLPKDDLSNSSSCHEKYPHSNSQHVKSLVNQRDPSVSSTYSESICAFVDSNCNENKFENSNNYSLKVLNKVDLAVNDCQKNDDVINKDFIQSVSIVRREDIIATKQSKEGCNLETNNINNKSSSDVNSVVPKEFSLNCFSIVDDSHKLVYLNDCECTLEITEAMDNAVVLSSKGDNSKEPEPHGSSDIDGSYEKLPKPESNSAQLFEPCASQSMGECDKNEHDCSRVISDEIKNSRNIKCEKEKNDELQLHENSEDTIDKPTMKQDIYCSTPNVANKLQDDFLNQTADADISVLGPISPLSSTNFKGKPNLKRKLSGLQPIEELDEDGDISSEKKIKVIEDLNKVPNSVAAVETDTSSIAYCFEVPAKSLLKKWQPNRLSRNTSSSFVVLDECGDSEPQDSSKINQDLELPKVDDFEIAYQSLTEELMKSSSSNIETLEKYHSQIQLENQIDDEKFDEVLQELTMNYDLDDETCLSLKTMDESTLTEVDKTSHTIKPLEFSEGEIRDESDIVSSISENNITIVQKNSQHNTNDNLNNVEVTFEPTTLENISEASTSSNNKADSEVQLIKDTPSTVDGGKTDMDEEDFLLEENVTSKDKPYVYFEFVSNDPKENEDNYNPEWQKLGRLTSDEERYKAVRDRWRSLVPPDPNRNLTYRQWRVKNNKSPIKLSRLNNNHQLLDDNQRSQLCTAVFESQINKTVQELESARISIKHEREKHFMDLARDQDEEHSRLRMRGANARELRLLCNRHIGDCKALKLQYDEELNRITNLTQSRIHSLREASEEVLQFQKFYKGVGDSDDSEVCMYLTDIQVEELMETERMLDQYKEYYG